MRERYAVYYTQRPLLPFKEGSPYIIDRRTMRVPPILHAFLMHRQNRRLNTLKSSAHNLCLWANFLDALDKELDDATVADGGRYLEALSRTKSPKTGRSFRPGTIRARLAAVAQLYDSTDSKDAPYRSGEPIHRKRNFSSLIPKQIHVKSIRPFDTNRYRIFARALGPLPSMARAEESSRNRLICEIGIQVGLRLGEIVGLNVDQFLDPTIRSDSVQPTIITIERKGGHQLPAIFEPELVSEIIQFIDKTSDVVAIEKGSRPLFVSSYGRRISTRRVQQVIEKTCQNAGLVFPKSSHPKSLRHRHTAHDLRHTFATWQFLVLVRTMTTDNALDVVRDKLGHRNIDTTRSTYLHLIDPSNGIGLFEPERIYEN